LVPVLSYILTKMVERNDKLPATDFKRTVFHAEKAPLISLPRYLERVLSFAPCSNSCFIIALIYIDRIIQTHSDFILNSLSVHRMLITSVMLATKFFDDETFNNLYYAKVGGLQVSELNQLEEKFLTLIDFTLTIPSDLFERYRCELMKHSKVSCAKTALSCSSSKVAHEPCESTTRSILSKSSGHVVSPACSSSPSSAPRSLRSSAPAIASSHRPPSLVHSICEALIIESVKNKALHPQLMTRMSELLTAEEKLHKKLPPGTIKTLCARITAENNLSPSLVTRATAHAERLERLTQMDTSIQACYQTGCDYAARDSVLSPPTHTKLNTEVNSLDFANMSVSNKTGAATGFTSQQCTPSGYSNASSSNRHTNNMVAV